MITWTRDLGASVYKDVVNGNINIDENSDKVERDYNGIRFEVRVNTDSNGKTVIGSVYPIGQAR